MRFIREIYKNTFTKGKLLMKSFVFLHEGEMEAFLMPQHK